MAGPLTIQRFPKGLIEILGMRATGDTPAALAQQIAGNLDLLDMYLLDRCKTQAITTGIALTVPGYITMGSASGPAAGFIWFVYDISVSFGAVGAASTLQSHVGISRIANVSINLPGMSSGLLNSGQASTVGIHFERPLIMRPGDLVSLSTPLLTGTPNVTPSGMMYLVEIGI